MPCAPLTCTPSTPLGPLIVTSPRRHGFDSLPAQSVVASPNGLALRLSSADEIPDMTGSTTVSQRRTRSVRSVRSQGRPECSLARGPVCLTNADSQHQRNKACGKGQTGNGQEDDVYHIARRPDSELPIPPQAGALVQQG